VLARCKSAGRLLALHLLKKRDKAPNTLDSPHLISTISTCLKDRFSSATYSFFATYRAKSYNLGYGSAEETTKLAASKTLQCEGIL